MWVKHGFLSGEVLGPAGLPPVLLAGKPKVGIRVPRFSHCPALPWPRVTSNGQPPSRLALTRVSLALPDMDLGSYDRLQPSPHIPPPLSALKYVLPEASGGSLPSSGPLPSGTLLLQGPSALFFGSYSKADAMLSVLHSLGGRAF